MPRFEIFESSGKRRPIDDGARHGHNAPGGFRETVECCSDLRPAVHATIHGSQMGRSRARTEARPPLIAGPSGRETTPQAAARPQQRQGPAAERGEVVASQEREIAKAAPAGFPERQHYATRDARGRHAGRLQVADRQARRTQSDR